MIHKGDSLPGSTGSRSCNRFSRSPLSEAVAKHIDLSATRRETLSWLALLIMQHGTICLWRLAAFVASAAQTSRFSVGSTQVLQAFPESSRRYREELPTLHVEHGDFLTGPRGPRVVVSRTTSVPHNGRRVLKRS